MAPLDTATKPGVRFAGPSLDVPHALIPAQEMQRPLAAREVLDRFCRVHAVSKTEALGYAGVFSAVAGGGAWLAHAFGTQLSWPIPTPKSEQEAWVVAAMATAAGVAAIVGGGYGLANNISNLFDPTKLLARGGREYYYRLGGYTGKPGLSDRFFGKLIHAVDHPSQLQDISTGDFVLLNGVTIEAVETQQYHIQGKTYYSAAITACHSGKRIYLHDSGLSKKGAESYHNIIGSTHCILGKLGNNNRITIEHLYGSQLSVVGEAVSASTREQNQSPTKTISPDILYDFRLDDMHDDTKRDVLIQIFRQVMTLSSQDERRRHILVLFEKLIGFKKKDYRWPVILEILSYLKHPEQEYREDAWLVVAQMKRYVEFTQKEKENIDSQLVRLASETDNADAKFDIDNWLRDWRS